MSARREIIASGLYIGGIMSALYLMGCDKYNIHAYSRDPKYVAHKYGIYRYFQLSDGNQFITYRALRQMEVHIKLPRPQDLAAERVYIPDEITVRI
jgi:hypothetical protein